MVFETTTTTTTKQPQQQQQPQQNNHNKTTTQPHNTSEYSLYLPIHVAPLEASQKFRRNHGGFASPDFQHRGTAQGGSDR